MNGNSVLARLFLAGLVAAAASLPTFADVSPDAPPDVKIREYEKIVRSTPGYAGFTVHNELRHLYSSQDPDKAMRECDIILTEEPMQDYTLSVISGWTLNDDPEKAIASLSAVGANNPKYHAVQSAAFIECGQLAWSLGKDDQAIQFYKQAWQVSHNDSKLAAYKGMAELALRQASAVPDTQAAASSGAPSMVAAQQQMNPFVPAPSNAAQQMTPFVPLPSNVAQMNAFAPQQMTAFAPPPPFAGTVGPNVGAAGAGQLRSNCIGPPRAVPLRSGPAARRAVVRPSESQAAKTVPHTIVDASTFTCDPVVWPNATSHANSDPWLVTNHDRIEQLRPSVLVINFANGVSVQKVSDRVNSLIAALRESSRYHGYADANARPFLDYHIFKLVDLSDSHDKRRGIDGNCGSFPWRPKDAPGSSFRYPALFEDKFTELYNVSDSRDPKHLLSLSDLVNAGYVNEVWFVAYQGDHGAPFESVELKQAYDKDFHPIPGSFVQAGNGGDPTQPRIGRSLRILFINVERGPGCAMESLGHSFEHMATGGAIPYLVPYFKDFGGFNLDKKYGMPFDSFYARDGCDLNYPAPTTITFNYKGRPYLFNNYVPVGGNVHFTINGRHDYDLDNPQPVLTTIEHFRMHDGPNGSDQTTVFTPAAYGRYRQLACDCMGPWMVYWRQNWPGFHSPAVDDQQWRMKNWWPFLFY